MQSSEEPEKPRRRICVDASFLLCKVDEYEENKIVEKSRFSCRAARVLFMVLLFEIELRRNHYFGMI